MAAFFGPAYLVSVGYMDPGNWATDLAGGSQFGFTLLWVLLMSNFMALLLQSLCVRLGIVRRRDLAQCNRELYPRYVIYILYVIAETAIIACDLAEVLGMAIGLNLLLDIPLLFGVIITALDTFLLLYLQKKGIRKMEAFILALIMVIGVCFFVEIIFARPDMAALAKGFFPTIPNNAALYIAIGIIGATVMPHNLYLHSALVQTRKIKPDPASIRQAIKINILDSAIALNAAFFVNAAILILAAAVFFTSGNQSVATLQDAHRLLAPLLGSEWASHLFAIALIAAGQSSTITGTLAGQIVMEGYLRLRINPMTRRLITRALAIIPAAAIIAFSDEPMVDKMLIFSQVILSLQLAFAVIPLIYCVSNKTTMGAFAIGRWTKSLAWLITWVLLFLNLKLVYETMTDWIRAADTFAVKGLIVLGGLGLLALLIVTIVYPLSKKVKHASANIHKSITNSSRFDVEAKPAFRKIGLALDYTEDDKAILSYALQFAGPGVSFVLMHVVESPATEWTGDPSGDYETQKDRQIINKYKHFFEARHIAAEAYLGYKYRSKEISRLAQHHGIDLLIVGSHGHQGMKDFILGETINRLRHLTKVPILIAR